LTELEGFGTSVDKFLLEESVAFFFSSVGVDLLSVVFMDGVPKDAAVGFRFEACDEPVAMGTSKIVFFVVLKDESFLFSLWVRTGHNSSLELKKTMGDKTHEVDEDITWCTPGILQTEEIKTLLGYFTCYLKKKPDYEVLCLMIDETHIPQDDLEERKVIDYPKVERKMEKMSVLLEDAAFIDQ